MLQDIRKVHQLVNKVGCNECGVVPKYSMEEWVIFHFSPQSAPLDVQLFFTGAKMPMQKGEEIKHNVALEFRVTVAQIVGRSRLKKFTRARKKAMYEVFKQTGYPLSQIGRMFGGRDHTTVISNIKRYCRDNNLEIPHGRIWKSRGHAKRNNLPLPDSNQVTE
ncbi:helix-turn-helix domain-containing protein [Roseibium sp. RKSG952]|uniref:helix-turn-helix domain-containing protein n=1 Tax=Roseibium sp. RKSG952 TaxID=2529384 RepID=UPI0012BC41BC|nr:helix-turn-helix domain-containing protein [Roseibium sp. RKSG952]MTH96563.1 hypothetical protein [Roseibium sp. RKSG952]